MIEILSRLVVTRLLTARLLAARLLAAGLLLLAPLLPTAHAQEPDGHQVFLPLVTTTPGDIFSQMLYSMGGVDNLLHTSGSLSFFSRGHYLAIVDISDPRRPLPLRSFQLPGAPTSITVQGEYAYLTLGYAGFAILDLHDPSKASLLSRLPLAGMSGHALLAGSLAYVSSSQALYVLDISEPDNPRLLGSATMDAGFALFHESLLLVRTGLGFNLVDVNNSSAPGILGIFENYYSSGILAVEGDYVYMNGWGCGILGCDDYIDIIDISDPNNPAYAGLFQTNSAAGSIIFNGEIAYISDGYDLIVARMIPGGSLEQLSIHQTETHGSIFLLENDLLYLRAPTGLEILDVSDADTPEHIDTYNLPGYTLDALQPALPYLYARAVPDGEPGGEKSLLVLDVSDPDDVEPVSASPLSGFELPPAFFADQLYLGDGRLLVTYLTGKWINYYQEMGIKVHSLGQAGEPLGSVEYIPNGGARDQEMQGSTAYIVNLWRKLEIVDLSDPDAPELLATYLANARLVSADQGVVYLADEVADETGASLHLLALDLTDPLSPTLLSDTVIDPAFSLYNYAFTVHRGLACFSLPDLLRLVDVSDPSHPVVLGDLPFEPEDDPFSIGAYTIDAGDGFAALGVDGTLKIVNISQPLTPTLLAEVGLGWHIRSVQVLGDQVYAASSTGGFVLDLSDPALPVITQVYPGPAGFIQTQPGYPVYVSRGSDGVEIYRP